MQERRCRLRWIQLLVPMILTCLGCLSNRKLPEPDQLGSEQLEQDISIRYSDSCSAPGSAFTQITITVEANGECTYQNSTGRTADRSVHNAPPVQFQSSKFAKASRDFVRRFQRLDEQPPSGDKKIGGRMKHLWVTCGERDYSTSAESDQSPNGYRDFMTLVEKANNESKKVD
jgi:uncharacterized protein with GYD domain